MKNFFFVFLLLLCCVASLQAQSLAQLNGRVVESNGQAVEWATVILLNLPDLTLVKGTLTNADGTFAIEAIEAGNYLVEVSMVGFASVQTEAVAVQAGEIKSLPVLTLLPRTESLKEVTITARKPTIEVQAEQNGVQRQCIR